jgi:hypothetical protein
MFATPTTVKTRTCIWEVSGLCFVRDQKTHHPFASSSSSGITDENKYKVHSFIYLLIH